MTRKGQGVSRETGTTIRQIEFELEKAEHGMGLPYDAERVTQLRSMLASKADLRRGPFGIRWTID
jgi:hypothetical protein